MQVNQVGEPLMDVFQQEEGGMQMRFLALNIYYQSWKGSRHIRIKSEKNNSIFEQYNNMGGQSL